MWLHHAYIYRTFAQHCYVIWIFWGKKIIISNKTKVYTQIKEDEETDFKRIVFHCWSGWYFKKNIFNRIFSKSFEHVKRNCFKRSGACKRLVLMHCLCNTLRMCGFFSDVITKPLYGVWLNPELNLDSFAENHILFLQSVVL